MYSLLYNKKIILFFLYLNIIFAKPKGAHIDSKKLPKIIEKFDNVIVLMYEDWCTHSQEANKIFKQLMVDQELKDLDIIFAFFDLKKETEYKQFNSIKEIPEIHLYIKKTQIKFAGNIDKQNIKNFIIEKLQYDNIQQINNEDLNRLKDSQSSFFLYYGLKDSPRYHLFLEGHYIFPQYKFYYTNNTLMASQQQLEKDQIYYFNQKENYFVKYKKAFKREKLQHWITALKRKNFIDINKEDFYERIVANQSPYLVLFLDESEKSKIIYDLIHDNLQVYFEYFPAVICRTQNQFCENFKQKLYFNPQTPSVFIMTFNKTIQQPLFYQFKGNEKNSFKKFIDDFQNGERTYTIFSQDIHVQPDYSSNEESSIVTRDYFKEFLLNNLDKDNVILFFNSKNEEATSILDFYQNITKKLLQNANNKINLSFGYYDVSQNSCDVFQISDADAQIIIYKQASLENQSKLVIDLDSDNFAEIFLDFLDLRATHKLTLQDEETDEI